MRALFERVDILSPSFVAALCTLATFSVGVLVRQLLRLPRRPTRSRLRQGLALLAAGSAVILLVPAATADVVNYHYEFLPNLAVAVGMRTWPSAPLPQVLAVERPSPTSYGQTVPATPARPRFPLGVVTRLPISGQVSGFGTRTAYVYLPPQYFLDPGRRFPVAYLLHGAPGAPIDWFRADQAARAGLDVARGGRPVILVAPQLSRSWLSDSECVNGAQGNVETYLARDVPTAVDNVFRTQSTRASRLLVGLSAGGYCALNVGLRHRAEFGAFADLSGLDRPTHSGGASALFGHGDAAPLLAAANSPYLYVPRMPPAPAVRGYLAVARADHGPYAAALRMQRELTAAHQPVILRVSAGSHNYAFWRAQLPAALSWWQD